MKLKNDHPFLTTSQDVKEIIKPLQRFDINFFGYKLCYKDGSRFYLNSDAEFMRYYFNKECYTYANTESYPADSRPRIALWSTVGQEELYDDVRERFDYDHGLYLIIPGKDYFELFSFATSSKNDFVLNQYFASFEFFLGFTAYFNDKANAIISKAEQSRILAPVRQIELGMPFEQKQLDTAVNALKKTNSESINLSARQWECARHLIEGKTVGQMADATGLSARTIEFYLANLRKKLQCRNKAQLIVKLLEIIRGGSRS